MTRGRVVIITQARMTSTRLPGKIAIQILGKSLLEHHLERLMRSSLASQIVVATTINSSDDLIVKTSEGLGISVYRGSEHDVLTRYYHAAIKFDADIIVRVTSDCPFIDPEIVDKTISHYLSLEPDIDYVSNCRIRQTYPRGLDTEVFSFANLKLAYEQAGAPLEREHVTPFLWQHPERFELSNIDHDVDLSHHRWTVDTPADLNLIKRMLESVYPSNPKFLLQDCVKLIRENPEWENINKHIKQKKL